MLMLYRLKSLLRMRDDANRSTLLWGTIIAFVIGVLGIATPVDMTMRLARQKLLSHPASGDIVVVGIDDKSLAAIGDWPWNRAVHAKLVNELNRLGAKRIVFDFTLSKYTEGSGDEQLVEAMRNAEGKVFSSARHGVDKQSGAKFEEMPAEPFARYAGITSLYWKSNGFDEVWSLPFVDKIGTKYVNSLSNIIANVKNLNLQSYAVDYSIDLKTVNTISAIDIIRGHVAANVMSGKSIVVALTSVTLGDIKTVPGFGNASGAYIHVAGAETLKRGIPISIGWILPLFCAVLLSASFLWLKNRKFARMIFLVGCLLLIVGPLLLEMALVFGSYGPALVLMSYTAMRRFWREFRNKSVTTNQVSGFQNLNALKSLQLTPGDVLVVARVHNYAKAVSVIATNDEEILVAEIVKRLSVARDANPVFHADDGIFVWVQSKDESFDLTGQLSGRRALFNTSFNVGEQSVDLSITFGVNDLFGTSTMNRFSAALSAADDAFDQGEIWISVDNQRVTKNKWDISLVGRLHEAIDAGQVWVAFQPKMDVRSGLIFGVEALARWTDPVDGEISPEVFVAAAEAQNRTEKLTEFVLDRALALCKEVEPQHEDFSVAVNLSAKSLGNMRVVSMVCDALQRHSITAERLTLELTETTSIEQSGNAAATLAALTDLGVKISIDDYGTGFSSLEYLTRIPSDEIKIDRQFLKNIVSSRNDQKIVASTIDLAHSLGRTVVAEGVENKEMLTILESMRCDAAQGYYIGMPMSDQELFAKVIIPVERKWVAKG
jgi:diguanylate cyclase